MGSTEQVAATVRPVVKRYEYIHVVPVGSTGKTSIWSVRNNKSQGELGQIRWYGAWRQYCFFPVFGTVFSAGCLSDIYRFISDEMERRRNGFAPNQRG